METRGRHLLAEYHGCDAAVLDDEGALESLLRRAAEQAGATVVRTVLHRFSPQGVSGVVLIEESHLSIHTWPESGYAAVDFFTCGDCTPDLAVELLRVGLKAERVEVLFVTRGRPLPGPTLRIEEHRIDETPAADGRQGPA